jgi:serine/threonine protein kinase
VDIERRSFKLIMRESWFLQQLCHRNIACLLHQYMSPNSAPNDRNPTAYFIQEDCGKTLQTYLRNRLLDSTWDSVTQTGVLNVVPLGTVKQVLEGLLSALVCLESHGVLHRDIKEDNCLIFGDEPHIVAKLIDFGLAKKLSMDQADVNEPSKQFHRQNQYAPEALFRTNPGQCGKFTHKSDLWALGTMIIWPMLFWACPDNLKTDLKTQNQLGRKFPFPGPDPDLFTQEILKDLIQRHLLDRFPKDHTTTQLDKDLFKLICDILEKMCVVTLHVFSLNVTAPFCF